jgi:hypothetical protein
VEKAARNKEEICHTCRMMALAVVLSLVQGNSSRMGDDTLIVPLRPVMLVMFRIHRKYHFRDTGQQYYLKYEDDAYA